MLQAMVKKGRVIAEEIPAPMASRGCVLIKVTHSCISAGTELMGLGDRSGRKAKKSALNLTYIRKGITSLLCEGPPVALAKARAVLTPPPPPKEVSPHLPGTPLGYSVSGIVIAAGEGVKDFRLGDTVAAAGGGLANHAEYVDVPVNLVVPIPADMDLAEASTITLGSIALQGVRRADLRLGEFAVVVGTGILGLLAVQLLRATGVRVAAVDLDDKRLELAKEMGAEATVNPLHEDQLSLISKLTGGRLADAVLFTASTDKSEPLSLAFKMCKRKGHVVMVGVSGMDINRNDMYWKELDLRLSTSYGPGRYDERYELQGVDYPYAYVRWTENRNMREYLRLVHNKTVDVGRMISATFPIADVTRAFEALQAPEDRPIIVILDYGRALTDDLESYAQHPRKIAFSTKAVSRERVQVAIVGPGGFAMGYHVPNLKKLGERCTIHAVMSRTGPKAKGAAVQCDARYGTTRYEDILEDEEVDVVLIATRHDSHAALARQALDAGKHVFLEKPLATNYDELETITSFYDDGTDGKPLLMVGFNRRFSKYAREMKKHADRRINPLVANYRMNAGFFPPEHWVHQAGGRIIGEGCHIIDLMTYLTGARIQSISCEGLTPRNEKYSASDNKTIVLKYEDGSVCTIQYFSVGSKSLPKECLELHFDEKTIVMDDYQRLTGYGIEVDELAGEEIDKGHFEELEAFLTALKQEPVEWPIPLWDMVQSTQATFLVS